MTRNIALGPAAAPRRRIALTCALALVPLSLTLTACGGGSDPLAAAPYDAAGQIALHGVTGGSSVPGRPLEVTATEEGSRIIDVTARDAAGRRLSGELDQDGTRWRSTHPLAGDTRYTVRVSTERASGAQGRGTLSFRTRPLRGEKLTVKFGPKAGTYGVGQPIVARLNHKISKPEERARVERALHVHSTPQVQGSWHWVDDTTLHYRPPEYWPAHATITVSSALQGVRIRKGLHGGAATPLRLRTGDRIEAITDIDAHTMTFKRNGKVVRTIPVTTGKEGFRTRKGIKVILAKEQYVRMRGTSVGIAAGSAENYDLPVYWASRLTWSGEYVHGAPWSAGSHGVANVSHGCTGMSTENAKWFFEHVRRGDVMRYVGGEGERMTPFDNGFGDWNLSWKQWRAGSALGEAENGAPAEPADLADADAGRLRPLPV